MLAQLDNLLEEIEDDRSQEKQQSYVVQSQQVQGKETIINRQEFASLDLQGV